MADHPGWYPPGQVCYPPELPLYLRNVNDLKPIVGVPQDDEVLAIHTVIQAANGLRVSGVPGMHDPSLFMKLTNHLFNVQMARYRSRYSLITFPSDATYTPPTLPSHIAVNLEAVSGAPSDDEIMKVQDAIQTYQELRRVPSMFDVHLDMALSQHLFDLQMARHMRTAGETQPNPGLRVSSEPTDVAQTTGYASESPQDPLATTNNIGTGANTIDAPQTSQLAPAIDVRDLMGRSNQLAERSNQLLERSNELLERCGQTSMDQPNLHSTSERISQVLERLTQLVDQPRRPDERPDSLTERFNQLFERFNQLVEQSNQPAQKANELAERSNELADAANQLATKLGQAFEQSNQLSERSLEQANKSQEVFEGLLKNINRVLVGVQHAIVRNHKGNTVNAIDCMVNEKGETAGIMHAEFRSTIRWLSEHHAARSGNKLSVIVDGMSQDCSISDGWVGAFLNFYGIFHELRKDPASIEIKEGWHHEARERLSDYLSSCLG